MTRRRGRRLTGPDRAEKRTDLMLRRESLLVLLSRAQRGVLTPAEGNLLRAHVETELADADTHHRNARGSQAAAQRYRKQAAAAEDTIREQEQRAEAAEREAAAFRAVFGPDALDTHRDALARAQAAEAQADEDRAALKQLSDAHADSMQRAAIAEADLATIRAGIRECGGNPTEVQNLYAQLKVRTGQWREAVRRVETAERNAREWQDAGREATSGVHDVLRRYRERAVRAEAAVARALAYAAELDEAYGVIGASIARELRARLDEPEQPADPCDCGHPTPHRRADCGGTAEPFLGDQPTPAHTGGNAEDCTVCIENAAAAAPPYPFLCPAPAPDLTGDQP